MELFQVFKLELISLYIFLFNNAKVNFSFLYMLAQAAKYIGAGIAVSAIAGAGTGIGTIFASLISSVARNPILKDQLFRYAILGFALTEAIALFGLMMSFLILFS